MDERARLRLAEVDWTIEPVRDGWEPGAWPSDGSDPFERSDELRWLGATNHQLSRAFPAGDWRGWGDWGDDAFMAALPMGYTSLYGLERIAVARDGEVMQPAGPVPAPTTTVTVHFLEPIKQLWVARSVAVDDVAEGLQVARTISRLGKRRALVSHLLRTAHWH